MAQTIYISGTLVPVAEARELAGPDAIVGLSTHSPEQLRAAEDASGDARPDYISVGPVWAFNGTSWLRGPDLGGFAHPVTFADEILFQAFNTLWKFDGVSVRTTGIAVGSPEGLYERAGDRLVVVTSDRRVLVTQDLDAWECAGTAPAGVTSIGVLGRTVWFGGEDAMIHAHDGPAW